MSTAAKRRTITELFTVERKQYYITLFFLGEFAGNYDNDDEVEAAKREIIGY